MLTSQPICRRGDEACYRPGLVPIPGYELILAHLHVANVVTNFNSPVPSGSIK
jgi:hypothetical protein